MKKECLRKAMRSTAGPVGVIGGMGPLATAEFYRKIVAESPATCDQEHVPLIVWGDPRIPDRSDAIVTGSTDPTDMIRSAAEGLIDAGARKLVVPCNTAHAFLDRALEGIDVPLISLVEQTVTEFRNHTGGSNQVAVLGTDGTAASGVYRRAFESADIRVIPLKSDQQTEVMHSIRLVKAARLAEARDVILGVLEELRGAGALVAIAACTELPMILETASAGVEVLDPMALAAREIVRQHEQSRTENAEQISQAS